MNGDDALQSLLENENDRRRAFLFAVGDAAEEGLVPYRVDDPWGKIFAYGWQREGYVTIETLDFFLGVPTTIGVRLTDKGREYCSEQRG
jgi:hypothetical protein